MNILARRGATIALILVSTGCNKPDDPADNIALAVAEAGAAQADEQLPLHEKDAEGAVRVVERAIGLVSSGNVAAIRPLLASGVEADTRISRGRKAYEAHREVRIVISGEGRTEGAAGSIYMTIPVTVSYMDAKDRAVHRIGSVTLRRSNDVPGATEEQLSWRIFDAAFDPPAG